MGFSHALMCSINLPGSNGYSISDTLCNDIIKTQIKRLGTERKKYYNIMCYKYVLVPQNNIKVDIILPR